MAQGSLPSHHGMPCLYIRMGGAISFDLEWITASSELILYDDVIYWAGTKSDRVLV